MGLLPFLPTVDRCCYCTRKLKLACILIDIWSMLIACHNVKMIFWPSCEEQYNESSGPMHLALTVTKWILFVLSLLLSVSSFAYLLGLFWSIPITAEVFLCFGILSAVVTILFAVMIIIQMIYAKCTNPSDALALILYFLLWGYFILIVNSYDMPKEL